MFNFCSARFSLTCCFSSCSSQPFPFPQLPVVTEMVSFLPVKMHTLALCLLLVLPGPLSCCWCWVMLLFHGLAWVCVVPAAFSVWSMSYHFSSVPCKHCAALTSLLITCRAVLPSSQPVPVLPHCACVALALSVLVCEQVFWSVHWPQSIECALIPGSSRQ